MPRKPSAETSPAIIKKLGATMRERTADIVGEELPDNIKKLLERMRTEVPKPKA
jgi:hypothetical protein